MLETNPHKMANHCLRYDYYTYNIIIQHGNIYVCRLATALSQAVLA